MSLTAAEAGAELSSDERLAGWDECEECGFNFQASALIKRYDGVKVCQKCWEPQHFQDMRRT